MSTRLIFPTNQGAWYKKRSLEYHAHQKVITAEVFLDFTLITHASDTAFNNKVYNGLIRLETNQSLTFPRDPLVEADYFKVQDLAGNTLTSLGSARVYDYNICPAGDPSAPDCNTGSVDLIGHINSLHFDGLANASG